MVYDYKYLLNWYKEKPLWQKVLWALPVVVVLIGLILLAVFLNKNPQQFETAPHNRLIEDLRKPLTDQQALLQAEEAKVQKELAAQDIKIKLQQQQAAAAHNQVTAAKTVDEVRNAIKGAK